MSSYYVHPHGYYNRSEYDQYMGEAPAYGPAWLCRSLGPVTRFCLETVPQRLDTWLKAKDEHYDTLLEPSAESHKILPRALFVQGVTGGARGFHRRVCKPWVLMAAAFGAVAGAGVMLGAGLVLAPVVALAALPLSTAVAGLALTGFGAALRGVFEAPRALLNIHVGYARRREFNEARQHEEDAAHEAEKTHLSALCRVLHDDERLAGKASPADRANWLCALAKQFPEEFLDAAKKPDSRAPAPAAEQNSSKNQHSWGIEI